MTDPCVVEGTLLRFEDYGFTGSGKRAKMVHTTSGLVYLMEPRLHLLTDEHIGKRLRLTCWRGDAWRIVHHVEVLPDPDTSSKASGVNVDDLLPADEAQALLPYLGRSTSTTGGNPCVRTIVRNGSPCTA